jgi:hypothetical protein
MATITERKFPSGNITYRVRLRKRGLPSFSLTFDCLIEASDWVQNNEKLFYENPDKYFEWRQSLYFEMQSEKLKVRGNLLKPKAVITKSVENGSKLVAAREYTVEKAYF